MSNNQQPDIATMLVGAADTICAQTGVDLREWAEWASNGGMLEMVMAHAVGHSKDARIRELEAQLNAAILARREAQQETQAAMEARNRAGVEIRRPLLARIAELEQSVTAPLPPYDCFSDNDGDSWADHPADEEFVHGRSVGDEFELLAGWTCKRVMFRVTKAPDEESDDYEVEQVTPHPTATPAAVPA